MKRGGFTLLELQAALFLGMVVVMLAGTLLHGEHARQIQLDRRARLRMLAARVDTTLQWACFRSETVETDPKRVVIHTRDDVWALDSNGFSRDFQPLLPEHQTAHLVSARIHQSELTLELALQAEGLTETVVFRYHLGKGVALR